MPNPDSIPPPRPRPSKFIHTHLSLTLTKHTHHTHSQQTLTTYTYLPQTLATHPTHHIFRHSTQAHTPTLTHHTAHSPHNTLTTHLLLTHHLLTHHLLTIYSLSLPLHLLSTPSPLNHHIHTPHTKHTLTTNVLLTTHSPFCTASHRAGWGEVEWRQGWEFTHLISERIASFCPKMSE